MEELQEIYTANNEKFEWYISNVINPGRIALLANELG